MKQLFRLLGSLLLAVALFIGTASANSSIDACYNYKKAGDYKRAIESGKSAVKQLPRSVDAHFCLGQSLMQVGDLNGALQSMKRAEELTSHKEDLMYIANYIGRIISTIGNYEEALKYYSSALTLAQDLRNTRMEASILNNLASVYDKQGNQDKALTYFNKSLALEPNESSKATTYNNIALIYSSRGDYSQAVEYLQKSIEIHNRAGDYHGVAQTILNLGDTYRSKALYQESESTLASGLEKIRKVGDRYWEATAYLYMGWLYRDMGDRQQARTYLQRAIDLYAKLGSASSEQNARISLSALNQPQTYAGIEIGAKGVKANVVVMTPKGDDWYDVDEKFRKSINTTIISGVKEKGVFEESSIEETAWAVKELHDQIIKKASVPVNDIFVVGSSAIWAVKNKDQLASKVKELTGKELNFINKDMEVLFNLSGSMPVKYRTSALSLDIGSGNTKIGYLDKSSKEIRSVAVEIPYGSVTLTDAAMKQVSDPAKYASAVERITKSEVATKLRQEMQKKPGLRNRRPVFAVGGIVWAVSVLTHPGNSEGYMKLTAADVDTFLNRLSKSPDGIFTVNLSNIKDDAARERAQKQVQAIKDTFSPENLLAGAKLLRTSMTELKLKEVYFSRYGSWLWGYVTQQGIYRDMLAQQQK